MTKSLHLKELNRITDAMCVYSLKVWQIQGSPFPTATTMSTALLK